MLRARVAALAAPLFVVVVAGAVLADGELAAARFVPLAAVAWPTSTLLVSEIQTGGASASDEFAEITNAGATTVDLAGLEVVYVTSTGGTITRKASWASSTLLAPGRHLLIANSSGIFGPLADTTYSGGFAATGGSIVLRPVGGAPVDAVGWGDATNAFVEGSPVAAPAAGSSVERKPGGLAGNTADTNSNATDFFTQASPNPQSLSAPPVPAPVPSPSTTPTVAPTPSPTPSPTPTIAPTDTPAASAEPTATTEPSVEPSALPSPSPSATPTPTVTPGPTETATPTDAPSPIASSGATDAPSPTDTPAATETPTPIPTVEPSLAPSLEPTSAPSVGPTPPPTPAPSMTPVPSPSTISIAEARELADGSTATIEGTLTTALGTLESGRVGFIQDATGGISIYLDAASVAPLSAGTIVRVQGTVDDRYAQRTLRVAWADVVVLGATAIPDALVVTTGSVSETVEGVRVQVAGTTLGSPSAYADGLGILVDDGTGSVRVIVGASALAGQSVPSGTSVVAIGPVGQHDSSGTGLTAYRIDATLAGELVIVPPPTPSPSPIPSLTPTASPAPSATPSGTPAATATPSPTTTPSASPGSTPGPTASPSATPAPTATPSPSPSPSPSATPSATAISAGRGSSIGTTITVTGVVTADAGRLGTPALLAIQDASGGIVVRVPDGVTAPERGATLQVTGPLADPYGQLELRPAAAGFRVVATGVLPAPTHIDAAALGETTEGTLVQLTGTASTRVVRGTSGDLSIDLTDAAGHAFKVLADASSGITQLDLPTGRALHVTGIVGQHASRKGALDGYRVWLRDRNDIASASPTPTPTPSGSTSVSIATAVRMVDGAAVSVEGTVTATTALLDASGRRIVIQDASAAIEVLLPAGTPAPRVGGVLRISGTTAHAWGAPRIRATTAEDAHAQIPVQPVSRTSALGSGEEWRLVRLTGTITKVERLGDRWRSDLRLAGSTVTVPVLGLAGAGIPSTAVGDGRSATIIGIVKRPYPTATDRRFALVPRGPADLALGPATKPGSGTGTGGRPGPGGSGSASGSTTGGASGSGEAADATPDTDLVDLAAHVGGHVKVGGLISALTSDGFVLDDGTATATVVLSADALVLRPYLHAGDALGATGTVASDGDQLRVRVVAAADLVRIGDLGQAMPITGGSPDPGAASRDPGAASGDPGTSGGVQAGGPGASPSLAGIHAFDPLVGPFGLAAMLALTGLSIAVTLLRRHAERQRVRAVVLARLAGLRPLREQTAAQAPAGGTGAERESA